MSWFNIALIIGLALLFPTAYAAKIGAPYVPARSRAIRCSFKNINIGPKDVFIDLGAGDGKTVLEAAQRGAKAVGYELSPVMWLIAWTRILLWRWRHRQYGTHRPKIQWRNFYRQKLTDATVLYAFLLPQNMERLRKYLAKQQIPNGKYMLVYAFPFKDVTPLTVIREPKCLPMYVYGLKELTQA